MAKRTTSKATKFHATQIAYMATRAAYETAIAAHVAECRSLGLYDRDDDAAFDAQEDISEKHGTSRLWQAMREAERAMVAWSVDHAKKFAPKQAALVDDLAELVERHPMYWDQLVDIAARLAA